MSTVRVLVGTRKGAFILTSDGKRQNWDVSGPHFAGWEMYHLKGSPEDPNRIYASQSSSWFGQIIQRSDDGGKTWHQPGTPRGKKLNRPKASPKARATSFPTTKTPRRSPRISGTTARSIRGSSSGCGILSRRSPIPDTVYAGVEDAGLFRSTDGGENWHELPGLRGHGTGPKWQPGAGGMCLHTIILDPRNPQRMYIAISAAGAFRTDDGGKSWKPINRGLRSQYIPDPNAEVGHCVHHVAMHPAASGHALHAKALGRHALRQRRRQLERSQRQPAHRLRLRHRRARARAGDDLRRPHQERQRTLRARRQAARVQEQIGGNEWEPLTRGLPQKDCYVNVLRDAMAVDTLDKCGVYFGTTGGQVYASADGGDNWNAIVRDLPAVLSVEVQTIG